MITRRRSRAASAHVDVVVPGGNADTELVLRARRPSQFELDALPPLDEIRSRALAGDIDQLMLDFVAACCTGLYARIGDELEAVRVPVGYGRPVLLDRSFGRLVGLPWVRTPRQAAFVLFAPQGSIDRDVLAGCVEEIVRWAER